MNFDTPTEKLAFSLVYSLFDGYIGEDDGTDNRDRFLSTEKNDNEPLYRLFQKNN